MWRKSVTSAPSPLPEVERAGIAARRARAKKKQGQKKTMTYTGYHTAQKRRARRGDRPLEQSIRGNEELGESRTETNAEKWRKEKEKNKRTNKRNRGTSPQSAARQGCQRKSDAPNRLAAERAAIPTGAFAPTQVAAAAAAAAPLFLRFLSLSEVSAPPLPPSPPPEDTPRRSSLSLFRL